MNEPHDARQAREVVLMVDAEVLRADAAIGAHRCRLSQDKGGAADRAAGEVDEVPITRESVYCRVLTHRRDEDAVGERQGANDEGIEQVGHARRGENAEEELYPRCDGCTLS